MGWRMLGYHVVFRAADDRILAPTVAARRAFAGVMARIGRPHGLFGFGLADTHGHGGLVRDEDATEDAAIADAKALRRLNRFIHDTRLALGHCLKLRMLAPTVRPIRDTWHAESVLGYMHRQDEHHDVHMDPLREGTSLHDLCGLRPSGLWLADRVRTLLPRLQLADFLQHWRLAELVEADHLESLAAAGAASIGVGALSGRTEEHVAARRACVHATIAESGLVGEALGISQRQVRHLRTQAPNPDLVRAIRLQMGLRAGVPVQEKGFFT